MKHTKLIGSLTILIMIFSIVFISAAYAADKYWVGTDGNWDDTANWGLTSGGAGGEAQPQAGEIAYLTQSDNINRAVNYQSSIDPLLSRLRIDSTGTGTMALNQSQDVLSTERTYVGIDGRGIFNQDGGDHNISNLLIAGFNSTGDGTYNLSGGSLNATDPNWGEYIGYDGGTGTINHSDGSNSVYGNLYLGVLGSGAGEYNLSNAGILVANQEYVGIYGDGNFKQTGGTHNADVLYLGFYEGSTGIYNLKDGGLNVEDNYSTSMDYIDGQEYIGVDSLGIFTQSGGEHNVANDLNLGYSYSNAVNSLGIYSLKDGDLSVGDDEFVGVTGEGIFTQSGGTNTVNDRLVLGETASGIGTFNLSNSGILSADSEEIGNAGVGTFNQTGGTNDVTGNVTIGNTPGGTGTYNLRGGDLNADTLVNNGTFNYSGGSLSADIDNNATTNVNGEGVRVIDGNVVNDGILKTTDTTVVFTGDFTNNASYISDPAVNYYLGNLFTGEDGYLTGGIGDEFWVGQNFINSSTKNTLWNTNDALLGFSDYFSAIGLGSGALTHNFFLTGSDLGADMTGYANNFAWGALSLAGGNSLYLFDGNLTDGGALYLNELFLADGLSQLSNIYDNGLNIYYRADLDINNYLNGQSYNLQDGGRLIPIGTRTPVPEPSTILLLGSGLLGLIKLRRHKK